MQNKKICRKCKLEKTLDQFNASPRNAGGLQTICRTCHAKACAEYKAANPDKVKNSAKKWRSEHKDRVRELGRMAQARLRKTTSGKKYRADKARRERGSLSNDYVKATILQESTIKREQITQYLVETKRQQLTINRLARQLKKGLKNESI